MDPLGSAFADSLRGINRSLIVILMRFLLISIGGGFARPKALYTKILLLEDLFDIIVRYKMRKLMQQIQINPHDKRFLLGQL